MKYPLILLTFFLDITVIMFATPKNKTPLIILFYFLFRSFKHKNKFCRDPFDKNKR